MNFQQLITALLARKKIALLTLVITVMTTLVLSLLLSKKYEASISLVIDQLAVDPVTGTSMPVQLIPGFMATQLDVIASHNVSKKVVNNLHLSQSEKWREDFAKTKFDGDIEDWIADELLEDVDVKLTKESSIINISYMTDNAGLSAEVANAFAEAYIQTSIELRAQPAKQRSIWLDNQIVNSRKRLEKARSILSEFQQTHGIVALDGKLDLEQAQLVSLSEKLLDSQAQTNELQSRKEQLKEKIQQGGLNDSMQEVIKSSLIQGLKSDLARSEAKFAELSNRVDKNHPRYKQAKAEVSALRRKLFSEIKIVLNSISSNADASSQRDKILSDSFIKQKEKVLKLKKQRDQMAVLNREVQNAQRDYDSGLQKVNQTRLESEISQANVGILNPAIPPQKPSSPRLMLNLILAIFFGSLLGVAGALLMEVLDRRVRSPKDIYDALDIPVFGVISEKDEGTTGMLLSHYQDGNKLPGQPGTNIQIY